MLKGTKLGRYEIREKIGSGGMGEVYLAQDEQLDRFVALKVLLPEFCSNSERVQRFKLEAKAASTINHPNIITIHEVGETKDRVYISTEYVDGVTLREKIEEGKLTVHDSIEIALQLADALAVAHEAHIVHRDIKPENVMIRHDGYVKILDFGLAKSILYQQPGKEDKTLQMVHTQPGLVMGSVRYMSPEQARGKDVDNRTDVWSLGVVLYEMLSGKNPFDGETVSDSIAALIHLEPAAIENIPEDLQEIVTKALRKNIDERYRGVKDFALDLRDVRNRLEHGSGEQKAFLNRNPSKTISVERYDTSENKTLIHNTISAETLARTASDSKRPVKSRNKWRFTPLLILLAAILLAAGMFYANYTKRSIQPEFQTLQVSRLTSDGKSSLPVLSADGKYLVYVNNENGYRSLNVKEIAADKTTQIVAPTNLIFLAPAFSADNTSIYYVTVDNGVGNLFQIPISGGTAKQIIKDVDSKVSFSPDGKSLAFVRHSIEKGIGTIMIADSDGSNEQQILTSAEVNSNKLGEIAWSPNGDVILFDSVTKAIGGNWIETKLFTVSVKDKTYRQLGTRDWINPGSFVWSKNGSGIYFIARGKENEPRQIRFISYPSGEERQISNDLNGYDSMTLASETNTIIASSLDTISSIWTFNPQNKSLSQLSQENRLFQGRGGILELPNGKLLFTITEGNRVDLWTSNSDGGDRKPLTSNAGINVHPAITPDGKFIVFSSNRSSGNFNIWRMDIDGKNPVQLIADNQGNNFRPQIVNGGKTIVYERSEINESKIELAKVSIDGTNAEPVHLNNETNDCLPKASTNGKKLAFTSQSLDVANLIFRSNLNIADISGELLKPEIKQVAQNLGYTYQWTKDDKFLSFISSLGTDNIFNYSPDTNSSEQVTNFSSGNILNFTWSNDGKKLYIVRAINNSDLILIKDGGK